jgi:hypothetical protein
MALASMLELRGGTIASGSKFFLDFVVAHWRKLGRDTSENGEAELSIRLALHTKLALLEPLQLLQQLVHFSDEMSALQSASLSGLSDERMAAINACITRTWGGVSDRKLSRYSCTVRRLSRVARALGASSSPARRRSSSSAMSSTGASDAGTDWDDGASQTSGWNGDNRSDGGMSTRSSISEMALGRAGSD